MYVGLIHFIYYIVALITMIMVMNIVLKCKIFLLKYGARTLQIYILQMYAMCFIKNTSLSTYLTKLGITLPIVLCIISFLLSTLLENKILGKPINCIFNLKWNFLKQDDKQWFYHLVLFIFLFLNYGNENLNLFKKNHFHHFD